MSIAKKSLIHNYCIPNAIFTFKEYLLDYASPDTKAVGNSVIDQTIGEFDEAKQNIIRKKLQLISDGQRDVYI